MEKEHAIREEVQVKKQFSNHQLPTQNSFFKPKEYPIPKLPLLDAMVQLVKQQKPVLDLSNTIVIGVQHILETTVTLFDAMIALGVKPGNMYFSGKCYSTAPEIEYQVKKRGIRLMKSNKPEQIGEYEKYCLKGIKKMWDICIEEISNKEVDKIIILDEGSRCLECMPEFVGLNYCVAAIEQTRAGLYSESINLLPFPLIEVASCAVKKTLEPPLIAEAVLTRLKDLLQKLNPGTKTIFGIVGNGAIGYAICRYLLSQHHTVVVYDSNESAFQNIVDKSFIRLGHIEEVINSANIIFGCTGKDITEGIDMLNLVKKDKVFISCTSEDKEFKSLLRTIAAQNIVSLDTLSDIVCLSRNRSKIIILQGGFPFNFDRKPWNVPAKNIEVTQGLLLGSFIQALTCATKPISDGVTINSSNRQCLNPYIQGYVALHWLPRQPAGEFSPEYLQLFNTIDWIQKNSGGNYQENYFVNKCFYLDNVNPAITNNIKAHL